MDVFDMCEELGNRNGIDFRFVCRKCGMVWYCDEDRLPKEHLNRKTDLICKGEIKRQRATGVEVKYEDED